jgi:hypothetical protein
MLSNCQKMKSKLAKTALIATLLTLTGVSTKAADNNAASHKDNASAAAATTANGSSTNSVSQSGATANNGSVATTPSSGSASSSEAKPGFWKKFTGFFKRDKADKSAGRSSGSTDTHSSAAAATTSPAS